ncbi:hypothetical protein C0995_009551 [Termitomyces sp. Mi166|nr:hypothetical protein C0995_009551 [Termitomyces sp. Mi166\
MTELEKSGHKADKKHEIDQDIVNVVFEAGTTFCRKLKTMANNIVYERYKEYLTCDFQAENQKHQYQEVKAKVKQLLEGEAFLMNSVDE